MIFPGGYELVERAAWKALARNGVLLQAVGCFRREELPKRGKTMHKVKVYDSAGKLKKVIPVKTLNKREDRKAESPGLFRKNKRNSKVWTAASKAQVRA